MFVSYGTLKFPFEINKVLIYQLLTGDTSHPPEETHFSCLYPDLILSVMTHPS